ncbi:MAG: 50S ribosomal protein L24 [Candidatus Niyogibacteria bacterium]|nr:50S ribosomal protein L24 [Candidatus Niyogibacteria bacterium]
MAIKIKKNDLVKILSGKDGGKSGRVLSVLSKENRVIVEGINVRKRHKRPRRQGEKGQIVQVPNSIHISNVLLICPKCKMPQRTKMVEGDQGKKNRACRKCGAEIS